MNYKVATKAPPTKHLTADAKVCLTKGTALYLEQNENNKTKMRPVFEQFFALFARLKVNAALTVARFHVANMTKELPPGTACKKGCSACCYQNVCVTPGETHVLKRHLTPKRRQQLEKLRNLQPDEYKPFNPDHACPFLEDGSCGIYNDRPLICRISFGSEPSKCCTDEPQMLPLATTADVIVSALWTAQGCESMPLALLEK